MARHHQRTTGSRTGRQSDKQSNLARCCRFCGAYLEHTFIDLGMSPLANSYVGAEKLNTMEPFYPLHVYVCKECLLVQLEEFTTPQNIFGDYAYFSSYSDSWLQHAEKYVAAVSERFTLGSKSLVMEIASNDGYLLQYFVKRRVPGSPWIKRGNRGLYASGENAGRCGALFLSYLPSTRLIPGAST